MLANIHAVPRIFFTPEHTVTSTDKSVYDVPGTHNVGLTTQYRFNAGPASQPIAGSMLVNRIRRWPNIETELGDCPVFALTAIRVHRRFILRKVTTWMKQYIGPIAK